MATAATPTASKFVTTIDFGTTNCSVAYLIRPDLARNPSEVEPIVLKLDSSGNRRVPSCILFGPNGKKIAFGYEAREQFADLNRDQRPRHHYFEHVKQHLQNEKDICRGQKISALNGKEFFLLDVIAHILHHLKDQLLIELRDHGKNLKASDFDWVITVPAIWKHSARGLMLEAGYMAGLCSDSVPQNLCIDAATCIQPLETSEKPLEKLSLALEPHSAAIHCRHKAKEASRGHEYLVKAEKYLVVDIGGGTVDIASHRVVGGHIEEIAPPVGNSSCGGTTVNEEFSKFLQEFVEDPNFSRYIIKCSRENQTRHKVDLNELIHTRFEKPKRRFGSLEASNSYIVEFPRSFLKMYQGFLVEKGSALNSEGEILVQVEEDGAVMRIYNTKMKEFFQPAIDGITNVIESHLEKYKIAREIDTIYWVGGFGGCKYLRSVLEKHLETKFQGCTYLFPVPPEPEFAVIQGAPFYDHSPSKLSGLHLAHDYNPLDGEPMLAPVTTPITPASPGNEMNKGSSSHIDLSPPPQPSPTSTDTLGEEDLVEITDYLLGMEKAQIYDLGVVLGLKQNKVKTMRDSDTFLDDVIAAWVRKEDNVKKKGEPSWTVLINALKNRRVSQTGIADDIAKDKGLPQ